MKSTGIVRKVDELGRIVLPVELRKKLNINIKDVVFVDDRIDVLRKSEELGITSYHPSSFME